MTQEDIRRKWESIDKREEKLAKELANLQNDCQHPDIVKKHDGYTGNYDPSADSYWIDFFCPDCRKNGEKTNDED